MIDSSMKNKVIQKLTEIKEKKGRVSILARQELAAAYNVGTSSIYRWEKQLHKEKKTDSQLMQSIKSIEDLVTRMENVAEKLEQSISIWEMGMTK